LTVYYDFFKEGVHGVMKFVNHCLMTGASAVVLNVAFNIQ